MYLIYPGVSSSQKAYADGPVFNTHDIAPQVISHFVTVFWKLMAGGSITFGLHISWTHRRCGYIKGTELAYYRCLGNKCIILGDHLTVIFLIDCTARKQKHAGKLVKKFQVFSRILFSTLQTSRATCVHCILGSKNVHVPTLISNLYF